MSQFGAKTRKNLRYCAKRFQRENPHAEFVIVTRDAIDEATVNGVVGLNHLRMESKGHASGIDTKFATALLALCHSSRRRLHSTRGGCRILGGTLCTRVEAGLSLQVIAHDPGFNHVRLGLLCLLKSMIRYRYGRNRVSFPLGRRPIQGSLRGSRGATIELSILPVVDSPVPRLSRTCASGSRSRRSAIARRLRATIRKAPAPRDSEK